MYGTNEWGGVKVDRITRGRDYTKGDGRRADNYFARLRMMERNAESQLTPCRIPIAEMRVCFHHKCYNREKCSIARATDRRPAEGKA